MSRWATVLIAPWPFFWTDRPDEEDWKHAYEITIDGQFIGMTVSKRDGPVIVRWLERAGLNDLLTYARAARERDNARDGR